MPILTANPEIPHAASTSLGVLADDLEDAERRAGGALGVVLVRGRDAEVGADAVALVGLHRAAVLLDRAAHHRHALADERLDLVGREPLAERRRADDVGEEDGDGATLVLHPSRSVAAARRRVPRSAGDGRRCEAARGPERRVLAQDRLLELPAAPGSARDRAPRRGAA